MGNATRDLSRTDPRHWRVRRHEQLVKYPSSLQSGRRDRSEARGHTTSGRTSYSDSARSFRASEPPTGAVLVLLLRRRAAGRGTRRFTEIKKGLDGISQRMLTLTLRGLKCDCMTVRTLV